MPWVNSCCWRIPLKNGTIITGIIGMMVGLATLIYIWATNIKLRTVVIDTLDPTIVKIIVGFHLIMTIIISLLLVIGAIKRKIWLIIPWIALAVTVAIGMIFSVIYTTVMLVKDDHVIAAVIWVIVALIGTAIFIYMWVVVFSFYQLLKEEKGKGPYNFPYGLR